VHVDYAERNEPEHKVERNLQLGRNLHEPHDSVKDNVPSFESHSSGRYGSAGTLATAGSQSVHHHNHDDS